MLILLEVRCVRGTVHVFEGYRCPERHLHPSNPCSSLVLDLQPPGVDFRVAVKGQGHGWELSRQVTGAGNVGKVRGVEQAFRLGRFVCNTLGFKDVHWDCY